MRTQPSGRRDASGTNPTAHFVTFAGVLRAEPAETMRRLQETLSFKNPPRISLGAVEARK